MATILRPSDVETIVFVSLKRLIIFIFIKMVEVRGVEPLCGVMSGITSTCVASDLFSFVRHYSTTRHILASRSPLCLRSVTAWRRQNHFSARSSTRFVPQRLPRSLIVFWVATVRQRGLRREHRISRERCSWHLNLGRIRLTCSPTVYTTRGSTLFITHRYRDTPM